MYHMQHQPNPHFNRNYTQTLDVRPFFDYGLNCVIVYNNYKIDKMDLVVGEIVSGNATSLYNPNRYISMHVFNIGDRVVRQTFDYYTSNTHKFKKCLFKVCMNTLKDTNGYRSRVGIFDDHNDKTIFPDTSGEGSNIVPNKGGAGLFFQLENNIFSIGLRYGVNNNGKDIIIKQDEFNVNKLQKESHNHFRRWDTVQDFEITYNTVGYIEWCVYIDGSRVVLHRYSKVNHHLRRIHRYDLPMRYEIEKIENVNGSAEMRQFEESISLENGCIGTASGEVTSISCPGICRQISAFSNKVYTIKVTDTYLPIFSVRLKSSFIRNPILCYQVDGMASSDCPAYFQIAIIKNPTFNGVQPIWIDTDYTIQYSDNSDTIDMTSLIITSENYITTNQPFPSINTLGRPISISSDIAGNSDIFTIVARKLDAKHIIKSFFSFKWVEDI